MYPHRLLLLNIICILGFSRMALATDLLTCKIPCNFTVDLAKDERAYFYGSQLTIRLNEDALVATTDKYSNTIEILAIEDVAVTFEGCWSMNNVVENFATEPERISQTYVDRISGIAQRVLLNSTYPTISRCRLVLLPIGMERPNVDQAIANEIRRFAETCLELAICPRIGEILIRSDRESTNVDSLPPSTDARYPHSSLGCEENSQTLQLFVNKLVDVALSEAITKVTNNVDGPIAIPRIDQIFYMGSGIFKISGFLKAVHGTFHGISTIRRVVDAVITHKGMKFMASCGFGLKIADLKYDHYWLKYGLFSVEGMMSGTVDGVALEAGVSVDYNLKPCVLSVEYLKVTEFGRMTIELTGLGPLNSMAVSLINWITRTWRDGIIRTIETELRTKITHEMSTLDCERFRP